MKSIVVIMAASLIFAGCGRRERSAHAVCIADSVGTLALAPVVPDCAGDEFLPCRVQCFAGSSASCLGLAYEAQKDPKKADETVRFFRRACLLGDANACTNFEATIWSTTHTDEELECARRTFEKACTAKEPFACGMVGRLMLEDTDPPRLAEGRRYLEAACDRVGGFPCRVLAKHLESGKLGSYEPDRIRTLLERACADGDSDACGSHVTAAETFH